MIRDHALAPEYQTQEANELVNFAFVHMRGRQIDLPRGGKTIKYPGGLIVPESIGF